MSGLSRPVILLVPWETFSFVLDRLCLGLMFCSLASCLQYLARASRLYNQYDFRRKTAFTTYPVQLIFTGFGFYRHARGSKDFDFSVS